MENKTKKPATVRAKTFFNKRLWESDMSKLGGIKGMGVAFLRVLITTINGIMGKRILVQASALSFATLLAIGPILAIVVIILNKEPHHNLLLSWMLLFALLQEDRVKEKSPQDMEQTRIPERMGCSI